MKIYDNIVLWRGKSIDCTIFGFSIHEFFQKMKTNNFGEEQTRSRRPWSNYGIVAFIGKSFVVGPGRTAGELIRLFFDGFMMFPLHFPHVFHRTICPKIPNFTGRSMTSTYGNEKPTNTANTSLCNVIGASLHFISCVFGSATCIYRYLQESWRTNLIY